MIAHVAFNALPDSQKLLLIGGGDERFCDRLSNIKAKIGILVEIDDMVSKLARVYFPTMAKGFNYLGSKRTSPIGLSFCEKSKEYDVVISDTSDPEGPADKLFQVEYIKLVHEVLIKQGVGFDAGIRECVIKADAARGAVDQMQSGICGGQINLCCLPSYTSGHWAS